MKEFNPINIELRGKNLIEASAGTGKTFSVGLLVLRLLLEKQIPIEKILMVTFTNAAVAEMEIRIRKFVKDAYLTALSPDNTPQEVDTSIENVVKKSVEKHGIEYVKKTLYKASTFLDETSIYTIHGFCQTTLSEFAFETGQFFNNELIEDDTLILENSINEYWRRNITTLDADILKVLLDNKFSRELLRRFVNNISNGLKFKDNYKVDENNIKKDLEEYKNNIEKVNQEFEDDVNANWNEIKSVKLRANAKLKKYCDEGDIKGFCEAFIEGYFAKKRPKYIESFDFLFHNVEAIQAAIADYNEYIEDLMSHFMAKAGQKVESEIEKNKKRNQVLSFHDLIAKLHNEVVTNDNKRLIRQLNNKYEAVFIDEFQDTDLLQYEIFDKTFGENESSIIFYIGDPKQSIYTFRGADINTYIRAKNDIGEQVFTMGTNYRSTEMLVNAMNEFFPLGRDCIKPSEINPFCSDSIEYEIVSANKKDNEYSIQKEGVASAFDIVNQTGAGSLDQLFKASVNEIKDLLSNHYLVEKGKKRRVEPKDICVLVRQKEHSKKIKEILAKDNIPSVIVDDRLVMETEEARDLYYVLYAIDSLDISSISRAITTSFCHYTSEELLTIDMELHRNRFLTYNDIWKSSGIYSVILKFIEDYGVRKNLLDSGNLLGNRIYTNLMHLAEILTEREYTDSYAPKLLLNWFQKAREGLKSVHKYEQQIESDDDSIEIMTIHKSKGLAFNIVILPQINMSVKSANLFDFITFREDDGFYFSYKKTERETELHNLKEEQENRRLLYVALTRAVYKCIVHYDGKQGAIGNFIPNIDAGSKYINIRQPLDDVEYKYRQKKEAKIEKNPLVPRKNFYSNWKLTSFSSLAAHASKTEIYNRKEVYDITDEYDQFIFSNLKKGANTGLLLHEIYERIDFSNSKYWEKTIVRTLKKYDYSKDFLPYFLQLLNITVSTELSPLGFSLSQLNPQRRINEMEFFFSFDEWNGYKISKLFEEINIAPDSISGVMHGFVDMIFEHESKFYVLDWKSNHLGFDLSDYDMENLKSEMQASSYNLQYLIYTIATKRYLEQHLNDFNYETDFGGVLYLFIRGMRQGKKTGIYFTKPNIEDIEKLERILI